MSKDAIYRQDAVDAINELHDKPNAWLDLAVEALEKLPSTEPERKKGKWIFVHPLQSDDSGAYMCSECKMGMWEIIPSVYHYCPNCGIEIEGKDLMEKLEEL